MCLPCLRTGVYHVSGLYRRWACPRSSFSAYNARTNDFRSNSTTRGLETALAVTGTFRTNPIAGPSRSAGPLPRLRARNVMGHPDANRDDCDLYIHLRGNLWRSLWRARLDVGLRALPLLRI